MAGTHTSTKTPFKLWCFGTVFARASIFLRLHLHIAPVCKHTHHTQRRGGETCQYEGRHSHIHKNTLQNMVFWHGFRASKNLVEASLAYRTRLPTRTKHNAVVEKHVNTRAGTHTSTKTPFKQWYFGTVLARAKICLRLHLHIAPVCQHTHQTHRRGGETCQHEGRHSHIHKSTPQNMVFWHSFRASKNLFEASLAYRTRLPTHAPNTTQWWRNMSTRGPALTHPQKHPSNNVFGAQFSREQTYF